MTKRAHVKVKPARATTRHEAQAQFNRKKSRLRLKQIKRRAMLGAAVFGVLVVGIGGAHMHATGQLERTTTSIANRYWNVTADAGFAVKQIYLTGREHADTAVVKAALDIQPGTPILKLSLSEIQSRLQAIPEVQSVVISRQLPDAMSIALTERQPVALWQRGGKHVLVDNDGVVLSQGHYPNIRALPVIVGNDAPKHVRELTALLASEPNLRNDVVAAVRVGDRRWNVQLKRDITVMLPETAPEQAWKRFAALVVKDALFSKAIRSVDMRVEDRVFIMPIDQPQHKSMITLTNARET